MNKLIGSSIDPKQLSLTIKGALLLIVPVVAVLIKMAGHQIDEDTLRQTVEVIGDATIAVGSAVSAIAMVIGAVRKVGASFK